MTKRFMITSLTVAIIFLITMVIIFFTDQKTSSSLLVDAATHRFNPHSSSSEEETQKQQNGVQNEKKKEKKQDEEKHAREFDTEERTWWYAKELRRKRKELLISNSNKESPHHLSPPLIASPTDGAYAGCREIRDHVDLRELLSTNKQAWIVLYNTSAVVTEQDKQYFATFKEAWEKFASVVTFGDSAAVVGAIDVVQNPDALCPELVNGEIFSHTKNAAKNENEKSEFENGVFGDLIDPTDKDFIKHSDESDAIRIRWYTSGAKFTIDEVEDTPTEVITYSSNVRNGASQDDAVLRGSIVYKGSKSYSALKTAAKDTFRSRVYDRNITSLEQLQTLINNNASSKKAFILIVPGSSKSSSSTAETDRQEFALHWISRQAQGKESSDEYNVTDKPGVFDNKLVFAIIEEDSEVGKELVGDNNNNQQKDTPTQLLFYERRRTNDIEYDEDGREFSSEFVVRPYNLTNISDVKNTARKMNNAVRPAPARKIVPAMECDSLSECFERFARHPRPFVVRNAPEIINREGNNFERIINRGLEMENQTEQFVEAVDPLTSDAVFIQIADAIRRFLNDTLHVNVLDGGGVLGLWEIPDIMKQKAYNLEGALELMILSPSRSFTTLHSDPFSQCETFQFIFKGEKRFELMDPKYHRVLKCFTDSGGVPGEEGNEDGAVCAETPENAVKSGVIDHIDIEMITVKTGDFIVWPRGWSHRVWTEEATLAANGYLDLEEKARSLEDVEAEIEKRKLKWEGKI